MRSVALRMPVLPGVKDTVKLVELDGALVVKVVVLSAVAVNSLKLVPMKDKAKPVRLATPVLRTTIVFVPVAPVLTLLKSRIDIASVKLLPEGDSTTISEFETATPVPRITVENGFSSLSLLAMRIVVE